MRGNEEKDVRIQKALNDWLQSTEKMETLVYKMIDGEISKSKLSSTGSVLKRQYRTLEELIKIY